MLLPHLCGQLDSGGFRVPSPGFTGTLRTGLASKLSTVIALHVVATAYGQWRTPALPLYGDDHERADFAP